MGVILSLNVGYIPKNNNDFNLKNNKSVKGRNFAATQRAQQNLFDKSSNGKFDASEAGKNFVKGVFSPVTQMFSSVKNFAIGAGIMAASTAVIIATGGAAAPILLAAGVGMGVLQAGSAAVKIVKAKNGDDIEKAFFDIGGATSTLGLSAIGAKPTLKQAGIKTDGLNTFSAIKKSFTSAKDMAVESYNVFKSGYYKANIANAVKIAKTPRNIKRYSKELCAEGQDTFKSSFNALKEVIPEEFQPRLKGRAKCEQSICEKMVKEMTLVIDDKIKTVKKNVNLSEAEREKSINLLLKERNEIRTNPTKAKGKVEDLLGARLTLDDISDKNIDKLVNALAEAARKGEIEILEIENYRGINSKYKGENDFYLTEAQVEKLANVSGNTDFVFKPKASGYTATQLKVKPKNGKVLELQIRGKKVDEFADIEHIPYDLSQGKDISKNNNQIGILLSKVQKTIQTMKKEDFARYQEYMYENYIHAQRVEKGLPSKAPQLPEGIDGILSVENIQQVASKIGKYDTKEIKNPFEIYSQLVAMSAIAKKD